MAFDLNTWQDKVKTNLKGWRDRMQKAGVKSIYAFVSASAIWPVVTAAQSGDWGAVAALGGVLSGMGSSLLVDKLKKWKNETAAAKDIQKEIQGNADLRSELDAVLQKQDAFSVAKAELQESERDWFEEVLQKELEQLGNSQKFTAVLHGSGAIAQGQNAKAVGEGGMIIEGSVSGGIVAAPGSKVIVVEQLSEKAHAIGQKSDSLRTAYLNHLFEAVHHVALSRIDPKTASDAEAQISLDAVYTALRTETPKMQQRDSKDEPNPDRKNRRLSALELLNSRDRLVLLGDPGSGKSTFVNFVALCLAGEALNNEQANLNLLTRPVPADDTDEEPEPQPWEHQALLPVRVVLRDFAATGLPARGEKASADHLWQFIESELVSAALPDYAKVLREELLKDGGLILLDGLDEVPEADQRRPQIKSAVEDFAGTYRHCRFLVTSRTYAYQKQEWQLSGFTEAVLAPFEKPQIRAFVEHWYHKGAVARGMKPEDAAGKAAQLKQAILNSDRLLGLAQRPLLLTLMASLHAWRGGTLPEKREELYAAAVDLLLNSWEDVKLERNPDGTVKSREPSLSEWLKTDRDKVRALLNELAYTVHAGQEELHGPADLAEKELVDGLLALSDNPEVKPKRLVEYLSKRSGLLLPHGVGVYTFPHRTFQEYLAACHLTDDDYPHKIAALVRSEPNRWREVALLACAKAYGGATSTIWNLIDELCHCDEDADSMTLEQAWGAHLAGESLVETADLAKVSPANQTKVDGVRSKLVEIITLKEFPAIERATAGANLARLGDPRPEIMTVENMQFFLVPGGDFWMGEGHDLHRNSIMDKDFWLSRFPISNAQYHAFVIAKGYQDASFWPEAKKVRIWQDGNVKGRPDSRDRSNPEDFGTPYNLSNHPVVGITWYEAMAFSRWLNKFCTDRLGNLEVRLPSEAEWEKAARGGEHLPLSPVRMPLLEVGSYTETGATKRNPRPKRMYPWGDSEKLDKADPNCANYSETNIGSTSAAGCFHVGASPSGCEEMSGNVWEWTRSLHQKYSYEPGDGREDLGASGVRVLRGGAFYDYAFYVRCAIRNGNVPDGRDNYIGFRVVLSPIYSEL